MAKKTKKKNRNNFKIIFLLGFLLLGAIIGLLVLIPFLNKAPRIACANSISCIKDLSGKYEEDTKGIFMGKTFDSAKYIAQKSVQEKQVLGQSTGVDKHIFVDLTAQRLYAYEGSKLVYSFLVSTGKWAPTPTGDFRIWIKLRYTRMVGGNSAIGTYYNLPNVPYTMYYYNSTVPKTAGYSLHGAYWHNNFGHPMSHGCVNISVENAGKLYYWANPPTNGNTTYATSENPGTLITIYGQAPAE